MVVVVVVIIFCVALPAVCKQAKAAQAKAKADAAAKEKADKEAAEAKERAAAAERKALTDAIKTARSGTVTSGPETSKFFFSCMFGVFCRVSVCVCVFFSRPVFEAYFRDLF